MNTARIRERVANPYPDDPLQCLRARLAARRYAKALPTAIACQDYFAELSDTPVRLLPGSHLPPGLHFGDELRALYGTPSTPGHYWVEFEEATPGLRRRWALEVVAAPELTISPLRLPQAQVGVYYTTTLTLARGGGNTAIWSVAHGHLPPGLRLYADSGALVGIPTTIGVWCCSIAAASCGRRTEVPLVMVVERGSARADGTAEADQRLSLLHSLLMRRAAERAQRQRG